VDGRKRTPDAGVRYTMTITRWLGHCWRTESIETSEAGQDAFVNYFSGR
jgi:hypothetical protein